MAKVKSGGIRNLIGRVGGNVYYMNKGQNIARELAPAVSNPRSEGQMEQRMRWANIVAFYRANLPWMKRGAFESKKQTWSDYNAFVSANSGISPVFLTKDQAAQGGAVVAPYVVTKGSLPSVALIAQDTDEEFITDLYLGDDIDISSSTTAAALSAALLENNNGLREGDQLSFILNMQQSSEGTPYIVARYYEFIIDSTDNRTLADIGLEGVIGDDYNNEMNCLVVYEGSAVCGCAVIVSRTTGGEIKVSTQAMVLNSDATAYLAGFTSDVAFQRAAASYGESDANFLAAGYSGKASNVSVPVAQSILSVQVGDRTFSNGVHITANDVNFGDTTPYAVTIRMASEPENVTSCAFRPAGSNPTPLSLMPVTIVGNEIHCTTTEFNQALSHVEIVAVDVVANGETYTF